MDLLTPAQTWAERERVLKNEGKQPDDAAHVHQSMPMVQQVTMFLSVFGPIAGLVVAMAMLWQRGSMGVGWGEVAAMLGMYALTGFGVTIGYHRLLTHRAFETSRAMKLFLAVCGSIAGQGAAIRWCATHRRHHQASDREGDPHSPHLHGESAWGLLRGMWHAHMGWLFHRDVVDSARSVPDLLEDRALLWIDRMYFPLVFVGILIPGAIIGGFTGTWEGFFSGIIWGGLVRICLLQHVTWCINSVCHVWGARPFRSADESTNNWLFAILALGEGWHNNHHAFPTSARHGLRWWQFDSSYLMIRGMKALGLVWNLRMPTESAMDAKAAES